MTPPIQFAGRTFAAESDAIGWLVAVAMDDHQLRGVATAAGLEASDAVHGDLNTIALWLGDALRATLERHRLAASSAADLETLIHPLPGGRPR